MPRISKQLKEALNKEKRKLLSTGLSFYLALFLILDKITSKG
ncbi:hypothetical protein BSBH6_04212 [Bacillus subtilis]|nr:hypothetical protein BSBH6_04212 [Bacillus subtilis]RPK19860.1 hypothetical protein BH5_04213 [Bacillus subtilis]